jgi:hypothetical protein
MSPVIGSELLPWNSQPVRPRWVSCFSCRCAVLHLPLCQRMFCQTHRRSLSLRLIRSSVLCMVLVLLSSRITFVTRLRG